MITGWSCRFISRYWNKCLVGLLYGSTASALLHHMKIIINNQSACHICYGVIQCSDFHSRLYWPQGRWAPAQKLQLVGISLAQVFREEAMLLTNGHVCVEYRDPACIKRSNSVPPEKPSVHCPAWKQAGAESILHYTARSCGTTVCR